MSSDQRDAGPVTDGDAAETAEAAPARSRTVRNLGLLLVAVVVLDILAVIFVPPFPAGGQPGQACDFPVCFINGTLEFPPPHVVADLDAANPMPTGQLVITFHPSITSTIVTMWIVGAILLLVFFAGTRRMAQVPGRIQNLVEFGYETLENFAVGIGGAAARRYVPVYAGFFILILFCNWSGLVPPVGKIAELRAPTSDVNITIGLALVSFGYFELQGFRTLGFAGYLGKYFPVYEFRNGLGAGLIAMFVGLIELMLEFVKPVTLSMRLFGNIYGGEVALGVMTALTLAIVPVALYGLELLLNLVQALIFSVLTLMFTLAAVESHHEEGDLGEEAMAHGDAQPSAAGAH